MIDDKEMENDFDNMDIFESIHELFRRRRKDMKAKQILGFFGGGSATQYSLYPSTYRAFLAGEGTLDYISFGGLARNPISGRLYCQYRQGSDHNSTRDADIKVTYSDDGFATKTTVVIAADADQDPLDNLSGSDCFVTSTGRIIVFYDKQRANGISVTYFKYADAADLSDLSAEQLYTTDYGGGAYISATGTCFEYNGIIYKSNWASTGISPAAQPTANVIYSSSDDGLTWTKLAEISPQVDNYDEACIARHPVTGTFYATIRDNVTKQLIIKSSTDLGVTWGNQVNTGIPAQAKSPIVITPNGNFCILTRDVPGFRTMIVTGNSVANLSASFFDEHLGAYMYGGLVWDGTKIQCTHHVETDNTATAGLSGPTITIYREIVESATSVAPPTQYDSAYRCVLDYVQANGETIPSDALKTKHNTIFASLRSGSFLSSIHFLNVGYHNDANLASISNREWMHPWVKILPVASPTYGAGGYALNGTTQYLNLVGSRIDGAGSTLSQNNIGIFCYIPNNAQDAAFGRVYGIGSTFLIPRASDGNCYFRVNSGGNTVFVHANGGGRFFAHRTDAANQKLRRNGTQIGTGAVASVSLVGQSDNFFMGAMNTGGSPFNFTVKTAPIIVISAGFSGSEATYEAIWDTYIDSL